MRNNFSNWLGACLTALAALVSAQCVHAIEPIEPIEVEYLWQAEPRFDIDWIGPDLAQRVTVSVSQINSERASERIFAAQSIVRVPKSTAFDGPRLLQAIIERLQRGEPQLVVRGAMVAAACQLDDGSNADALWRLARDDLLIQPTVELACIRWRSSTPREVWRARIQASSQASEQELARALNGLAASGAQEDLESLTQVATDATQSATVRLQAARAIGQVSTNSQLPLAEKLRTSSAANADYLAVTVLAGSPPGEVLEFRRDVAEHGSPIAQRSAFEWLCRHDSQWTQRKATTFLKHSDSAIRELAILQVTAADSPETLAALQEALQDVNPQLRSTARKQLLVYAARSQEHLVQVKNMLNERLVADDWQSLEQCIRLCVELKLPQHVDRLLELLDHAQPEVSITAGWALRHLADEDETFGKMFQRARVVSDLMAGNGEGPVVHEEDRRLVAHLLEALGQRRYEPAKEMLLLYIPKNNQRMGLITRMAGMWACGKFWENQENPSLTKELAARIADKGEMFPEPESVRYAATLALGWIAQPSTRGALVTNDEVKPMPIHFATKWALERLDTEERSAPKQQANTNEAAEPK